MCSIHFLRVTYIFFDFNKLIRICVGRWENNEFICEKLLPGRNEYYRQMFHKQLNLKFLSTVHYQHKSGRREIGVNKNIQNLKKIVGGVPTQF